MEARHSEEELVEMNEQQESGKVAPGAAGDALSPGSGSSYPEPPPPWPGPPIVGLMQIKEVMKRQGKKLKQTENPFLHAIRMYLDSIRLRRKPYPRWEAFERQLAFDYAFLIHVLAAKSRDAPRRQLLNLFLESLMLENTRGRPRKSRRQLKYLVHGQEMEYLWRSQLLEAWNSRQSLEEQHKDPLPHLKKRFSEDIIQALLAKKATPESFMARVYSKRSGISYGTTRNALREYEKLERKTVAQQKNLP